LARSDRIFRAKFQIEGGARNMGFWNEQNAVGCFQILSASCVEPT